MYLVHPVTANLLGMFEAIVSHLPQESKTIYGEHVWLHVNTLCFIYVKRVAQVLSIMTDLHQIGLCDPSATFPTEIQLGGPFGNRQFDFLKVTMFLQQVA